MVTHVLDGKSRAHLPRRPLAVSMAVVGEPGSAALAARMNGNADPSAIVHSPVLLILPRVQHETLIVAVPGEGRSTFPTGTTIHVSVAVDSAQDPDPDRAQLTARDVSGLSYLELATIGPDGDRLAVTTRLEDPEVPLGPLASRARAAARAVLGVDQVPDERQTGIDVRVDTSLSMLGSVRNGGVHAIMDIVAGISSVVSADEVPRVSLIGHRSVGLPAVDVTELAARTQEALLSSKFGVGFDPSVTTEGSVSGVRRMTVSITDSASGASLGGGDPLAVTVVVSPSRAALSSPEFVGAVVPPSPNGGDTSEFLLGDPEIVDQVVEAVLRPLVHNNGRLSGTVS
ncbi:hypothetical protein [Rhodococcus sp. LB1]|uniref:hypothetical protein n=1 Tax=Rhodococcus sp. LB1 TaxID=1807499 RepID=UPI00077AA332|nr:hypothetical protein [Rhodococcus sp. LB1]KXX62823.1 hypothetical protein AZG88_27665 [Rhodococcus sp. LB1]